MSCFQSKQKAFTLVEIMIAMFLGCVLLLISSQVLIQASQTNRMAQQQSLMQEAASMAKYFLERDIRRAGYYGGIKSAENISGTAKVQSFLPECLGGDEKFAMMLFPKIFSLNDYSKNYKCIEKKVDYSDVLVLRYLLPTKQVEAGSSARHKLYMRVNATKGVIFKAMDKNSYSNDLSNGSGDLYEVKSYIYYLRDTGRKCDGEIISGLYREYNNNLGYMEAEEIVSGVEQMQFRFLINGKLNNADQISINEWNQIEAVSISLLLRADCSESLPVSPASFSLQDFDFIPSTKNSFLRQVFNFDTALRN